MKQEWRDKICVADDVIPSGMIENWTRFLLNSVHWNANFEIGTSTLNNKVFEELENNKVYEQFQFTFTAKREGDQPQIDRKVDHLIYQPLVNWCMHNGFALQMDSIFRCKVNLQTRGKLHGIDKYNLPHVDGWSFELPNAKPNEYWTAIYYINNSDGDTYLFKDGVGMVSQAMESKDANVFNNFTFKSRITPKRGRLVVFPMEQVHAGSHPVKSNFRAVINYNFRLQKMANTDEIINDFFESYK